MTIYAGMIRQSSRATLFLNDTTTTEIYTLSLQDALPICPYAAGHETRLRTRTSVSKIWSICDSWMITGGDSAIVSPVTRSEEHTSELQSRQYLVSRLLLQNKTIPFLPHSASSARLVPHSS